MEKLYNKTQIENAQNRLCKVLPDHDVYNGQLFQKYYKAKITQDFTRKDLKRIDVKKSCFINSYFNAAAGTGSKFTKVIFENCDFSGANFQYCYFNECTFNKNTLIQGANFNHSFFVDCNFGDITIMQSTLFDCYFENCIFNKSQIESVTFENSVMHKCFLDDVNLAHLNLEYTRFDSVSMNAVTLPPYQIPYIIGAPLYLKTTCDNVNIHSDGESLTRKEYCELYEDLAAFFYSQGEYFPIANIYISLGKHELALKCIQLGIQEACDYQDFRLVKHFCKLACSNPHFNHNQLKGLYDLITNLSYDNGWDVNTIHSYLLNIGEIKELLMNNSLHKHRVEFVIKTNIEKDDLNSVNELYNQINEIVKNNCSEKHVDSIELRHNSPYELSVMCIDALPYILILISTMYSVLLVGNKFVDIFKNFEETRRVHQQNELYKLEREDKLLDIELKKRQLKQIEQQEAESNSSRKSNIYLINEIEHNIMCNTLESAKEIAPEYLHFKYSRYDPKQMN